VTTCDYIKGVKKEKTITYELSKELTEPAVLREVAIMPGIGEVISIRSAKAHLSGLLELVAAGREFVITSDGQPKARVVPMDAPARRKVFPGAAAHLRTMPMRTGPTGEELIRADRDGRGW